MPANLLLYPKLSKLSYGPDERPPKEPTPLVPPEKPLPEPIEPTPIIPPAQPLEPSEPAPIVPPTPNQYT